MTSSMKLILVILLAGIPRFSLQAADDTIVQANQLSEADRSIVLAEEARRAGRICDAIDHYEVALARLLAVNNLLQAAQVAFELGNEFSLFWQEDAARDYHELALAWRLLRAGPRELAASMIATAELCREEQPDRSLALLEAALRIDSDSDAFETEALGFGLMARRYLDHGDRPQAMLSAREALNVAVLSGDADLISALLKTSAFICWKGKDVREAIALIEAALGIGHSTDRLSFEVELLLILAEIRYDQKEFSKALVATEQAVAAARIIQPSILLAVSLGKLGDLYYREHDYERAMDHYQEALRLHQDNEFWPRITQILLAIGTIQEANLDFAKAIGSYTDAVTYAQLLHDRTEEITARYCLARIFAKTKDDRKAIEYYQAIIPLLDAHDAAALLITIHQKIAILHKDNFRFSEALAHLETAFSLSSRYALHEAETSTAKVLVEVYEAMAEEAHSAEDYQGASARYEQAYSHQKTLDKEPREVVYHLNRLGTECALAGDDERSMAYFTEANSKANETHDASLLAWVHRDWAFACAYLGDLEKALSHFQEALTLYRRLGKTDSICATMEWIGKINGQNGRRDLQFAYLEDALLLRSQQGNRDQVAILLNNLGILYTDLGRYDAALDRLARALIITRELGDAQRIATNHHNLGYTYSAMGLFDKALDHYATALDLKQKNNLSSADEIYSIGLVYLEMGEVAKAEQQLSRALMLYTENSDLPGQGRTLNAIASVHLSKNEFDEAAEALQREREIDLALGRTQPDDSSFLELAVARGDFQRALTLLDSIAPNIDRSHQDFRWLKTMEGITLLGLNRFEEASHALLEAVQLTEEVRSRSINTVGFLAGGQVGGRIRAYTALVEALAERWLLGQKTDALFARYGKNLAEAAFYFSELTKSRSLLETISAEALRTATFELPSQVKDRETELLDKVVAVDEQWSEMYKRGPKVFAHWTQRKQKATHELEQFILNLRRNFPEYALFRFPQPLRPSELVLKRHEVLIEYCLARQNVYAFTIHKGEVAKLVRLSTTKVDLEASVAQFVKPLQSPLTKEAYSAMQAHELYSSLMREPINLKQSNVDLIIVPDGILGVVPFEALIIEPASDDTEAVYVGDRWKVFYAQSAAIFSVNRVRKAVSAKHALCALGNPILSVHDPRYQQSEGFSPSLLDAAMTEVPGARDQSPAASTRRQWSESQFSAERKEQGYVPLPETELEVKAIVRLFGLESTPPTALLGENANETSLRYYLRETKQFIHFATHADLPGRIQGLKEPYLVLGQTSNKGVDDGYLTLSEVAGLRLDTELVTLSACLTGQGAVLAGEGVMNFARTFQQAGARNVLVTLWEISSQETVEFMTRFYAAIRDGHSMSDALLAARSDLRKTHAHPYYWAGFVLYGPGTGVP